MKNVIKQNPQQYVNILTNHPNETTDQLEVELRYRRLKEKWPKDFPELQGDGTKDAFLSSYIYIINFIRLAKKNRCNILIANKSRLKNSSGTNYIIYSYELLIANKSR